jgi:hypothetical protein
MNGHEWDEDYSREAQLQAQADAAERQGLPPGGDPAVDRYRLVVRALRTPLAIELPADFAAQLARRIALPEERHSLEDGLLSLLLLGIGITGLAYLQPVLASVLEGMHVSLPRVPWPLLVAASAAVAVAWLVDRSATLWKQQHH